MSTSTSGPKDSSSSSYSFFNAEAFFAPVMRDFARHPHKDFFIGCLTGLTEVLVDQPLVSLKNTLQKRVTAVGDPSKTAVPISKSLALSQLYAGAGANATGMSLITGVQMGVIGWTRKQLTKDKGLDALTIGEKVFSSLMGGLAAAPIASVSEMVMDAQRENIKRYEKNGKQGVRPTYRSTTKELWQLYRWRMLSLGLFQTAMRDMKFTFAYDVLGSYFTARLKRNAMFKTVVEQQQVIPFEVVALMVGGACAGAVGATISHPFDTWKTQRQSGMKTVFWPQGLHKMMYKRVQFGRRTGRWDQATVRLFRDLVREPYRGFGPRFTRVVMAVSLFNLVPWIVNERLKKYK